jgi:hypothetical protein
VDLFAEPSAVEIAIQKEEAVAFICHRYRLPTDVADRIVKMSKDVDQAYSIAELMRTSSAGDGQAAV